MGPFSTSAFLGGKLSLGLRKTVALGFVNVESMSVSLAFNSARQTPDQFQDVPRKENRHLMAEIQKKADENGCNAC